MFRPWRSFPLMVAAGLVLGLASGGVPAEYSKTVPQVMLIFAMAFSLTEISFRGIAPKDELRGLVIAFAMSYGVLGGLVALFGALAPEAEIRSGWILMAAVPPAVAVVPITSLLKGDVRRSLISNAFLYLFGLIAVPGLTLLVLGSTVPVQDLLVQTTLLIGLPILASRPLRGWKRIHEVRPVVVGLSFFVLVFAIAGSTRGSLLGRADLVAGLSALALLRTFGLGLLLLAASRFAGWSREDRIEAVTFASFKNLGLTTVLAFSFFGALASLPSIVSLIFEILWMMSLPFLFRTSARGVTEIAE